MAKHEEYQHWNDGKKAEVVASYLVLGNATMVEAVTGVPTGTIRWWKTQPWWGDLVSQIQQESDVELSSKLKTRVEKVLEVVEDRLQNGDFFFDQRTGEFIRKPVSLKDTWKVGREMIDVRMMLRRQREQTVDQKAVSDILGGLAKEFATMARRKMGDVIDVEVVDGSELSEGVRQLSGDSGTDSQASPTECSPTSANEDGASPQGGRTGCGPSETSGQGGLEQSVQPESPVQA